MVKLVLGCSNSTDLAKKLARRLKAAYKAVKTDYFPDGEFHIKIPQVKKKHVILVQSMYPHPNESLLEVVFAAQTAQELGAKRVTVIAPYLCYLRQDKRFHPGEAKSNSIMAALLTCADDIYTIDPHLHRITSLKEIFAVKAVALTANSLLGEYIKKHIKNGIVIGPDAESYQWAEGIAKHANLPVKVLKKKRYHARKVKIVVPKQLQEELHHKKAILVDDIVSTGHTLLEVAKGLRRHKIKSIYAVCVHGLFAEDALKKLKKAGVKVIATNTIQSSASKIDISPLLAHALR